jgi:transposase-like protein
MSEEREQKEYCPRCKDETMMMIHTSYCNPTTYICMDCGQTYAEIEGDLLLYVEREEL